jgi:hypothetical protein
VQVCKNGQQYLTRRCIRPPFILVAVGQKARCAVVLWSANQTRTKRLPGGAVYLDRFPHNVRLDQCFHGCFSGIPTIDLSL